MMNNSKNTSKKKAGKTTDWKNDARLEAPIEDSSWDRQLCFAPTNILESLGSNTPNGESSGDYFSRAGYSHLKK
jgi:hypothetical protein